MRSTPERYRLPLPGNRFSHILQRITMMADLGAFGLQFKLDDDRLQTGARVQRFSGSLTSFRRRATRPQPLALVIFLRGGHL